MSDLDHVIRFKGGVLGGERRVEPGPRPRLQHDYRIPVMPRVSVTSYQPARSGPNDPPRLSYEEDIYRWEGEQRNGEYIYHHVRPNIAGMQTEIRELRKRISELARAEEALEALKKLQTYLNNGF